MSRNNNRQRAEAAPEPEASSWRRRSSPADSCGLREKPGRSLANNPSGRPRMRNPKLLGQSQSPPKRSFSGAWAWAPLPCSDLRAFFCWVFRQASQACQEAFRRLPLNAVKYLVCQAPQGPFSGGLQPLNMAGFAPLSFCSCKGSRPPRPNLKKLEASSQPQSQTQIQTLHPSGLDRSPLFQDLQASKQEASSETQPNLAPALSRQVQKQMRRQERNQSSRRN